MEERREETASTPMQVWKVASAVQRTGLVSALNYSYVPQGPYYMGLELMCSICEVEEVVTLSQASLKMCPKRFVFEHMVPRL